MIEGVLPADQPAGECPGIGRDVLDVAGQAPQFILGTFEALTSLVDVAALDRVGGLADLLIVEA